MKAFTGYKPEAPVHRETLPAGGYAAKVLDAQELEYDWGNVLLISFDIIEGEYQDFFRRDYNAQTQEDKKWRGTLRLRVPKDDGSESDKWSKRAFNNAMWAVEESNFGYHWDWNETGLKGKIIGVLYRKKQWEMNGNNGWTTECCALDSVDNIRKGKFKIPKDKPLKTKTKTDDFTEVDDGDLPF